MPKTQEKLSTKFLHKTTEKNFAFYLTFWESVLYCGLLHKLLYINDLRQSRRAGICVTP